MRTRTFLVIGIFAALLVAGVGSYFASSHPDGLQHVAEQAGFADKEKASPTSGSPLSGYEVKGVHNDAVSGGLAGVTGAVAVLALAGGLTYAVRRRGSAGHGEADAAEHPAGEARGDGADPVAPRPGQEGC